MYFQSVIQICSFSYSYSNQKHQQADTKLNEQRQNKRKNINAPSDETNINHEKGSVLQGENKTKKKKTNTTDVNQ